DEIQKSVPFGVGKKLIQHKNHEVFHDPRWNVFFNIGKHEHDHLMLTARSQLRTGGACNHDVGVLVDEKKNDVWLGNHFGSRWFGHQTATGFMNLANNRRFSDKAARESMDANPLLLDLDSEVGTMYYKAMTLVGKYAYAGRDIALNKALNILGAKSLQEVHNHHNYAWKETHFGKEYIV